MNTGACQLLYTGAFLRPMGTAQIPKPIKNLGAFVRYCASVRLCGTSTGAFVKPMGTTQIPIPIINLGVFV